AVFRSRCPDRWRASDLGSANGTLLDGREIDTEWLTGDSSLLLYPNGPALEVTVASPVPSKPASDAPVS
ncbi:MAG: FHA domain-containing protein, partial [Xanthomonadaceae bacterium]|nr:FHA domain-containing protein [Xanthomonadaceae bacterium]